MTSVRGVGGNSSASAARSVSAPATLCAPSRSTSGACPSTSSRPGDRTAANASVTTSSGSGRSRKLSAAASAAAALSAWYAPWSGRYTPSYLASGVNRSTSRPAWARRFPLTPKSVERFSTRAAPRSRNNGASPGSVSPSTRVEPSFTMPALSAAISSRVGPRYSTWSTLTFVITATRPSTTLVASHVPPTPTSITATSTATSENHVSAAAVRISK